MGTATIAFELGALCIYYGFMHSEIECLSYAVTFSWSSFFSIAASVHLTAKAALDGEVVFAINKCFNIFNKVMMAIIMINIMRHSEVRGRMIFGGAAAFIAVGAVIVAICSAEALSVAVLIRLCLDKFKGTADLVKLHTNA